MPGVRTDVDEHRSAPDPCYVRVDKRFRRDGGRNAAPEVLDLHGRAGGRARREPRVGDGTTDGVAEGGAGDVSRQLPVEEHRLVAEDDALAVVDREAGQPA